MTFHIGFAVAIHSPGQTKCIFIHMAHLHIKKVKGQGQSSVYYVPSGIKKGELGIQGHNI